MINIKLWLIFKQNHYGVKPLRKLQLLHMIKKRKKKTKKLKKKKLKKIYSNQNSMTLKKITMDQNCLQYK